MAPVGQQDSLCVTGKAPSRTQANQSVSQSRAADRNDIAVVVHAQAILAYRRRRGCLAVRHPNVSTGMLGGTQMNPRERRPLSFELSSRSTGQISAYRAPVHKTITITAMSRPPLLKALLDSLTGNDLGGLDDPRIDRARLRHLRHDRYLPVHPGRSHPRDNRQQRNSRDRGSSPSTCLIGRSLAAPLLICIWRRTCWSRRTPRHSHRGMPKTTNPAGYALTCWRRPVVRLRCLSDPRFPNELFLARTFNSLGFAARREEWCDLIEPVWFGGTEPLLAGGWAANWGTRGVGGWDWSIYALLANRKDLFSVQPALARATHTGKTGTHATPEFHDKAFLDIEICQQAVGSYRLVDIARSRPASALAGLCAGGDDGTSAATGEKGQSDRWAVARLMGQRRVESHDALSRANVQPKAKTAERRTPANKP